MVVSGTVGHQGRSPLRGGVDPHRVVLATLSRRDPDIPTDLGWTPVVTKPLEVKGNVGPWDVAWVGELHAPVAVPAAASGATLPHGGAGVAGDGRGVGAVPR